jgi:hypothetical protein
VESGELGVCAKKICRDLISFSLINIRIIFFLLIGTLLLFGSLRFQGKELVKPYASKGIVSFEMASSVITSKHLLWEWKNDGLIKTVRNNILIDFLFIPFYVLLFYTLCGSISVRLRSTPAKLGVLLAFFSLIAGIFDVFENILMLSAYLGWYNFITTMLTAIFATLKFILLGLSILYVIVFGSQVIWMKLAKS